MGFSAGFVVTYSPLFFSNRPIMSADRLQGLLQRFSVSARMFHSGPLCGIHDFGPANGSGQLHLIKRGPVEVRYGAGEVLWIEEPSLVLCLQASPHRFVTDADTGADMACANVSVGSGRSNPLGQALPPMLVLPLAELSAAEALLDLLFEEAFSTRCGRQKVVDRLFEVVLILILRRLLDSGRIEQGLLAGLSHPRLAKALVAMHDAPGKPWPLSELAACAGMSRSRFAEVFASTVGMPPASYLAGFRIALAQDLLLSERPLQLIAEDVGYGSPAALSRAFSAHCGMPPRAWKQEQLQSHAAVA